MELFVSTEQACAFALTSLGEGYHGSGCLSISGYTKRNQKFVFTLSAVGAPGRVLYLSPESQDKGQKHFANGAVYWANRLCSFNHYEGLEYTLDLPDHPCGHRRAFVKIDPAPIPLAGEYDSDTDSCSSMDSDHNDHSDTPVSTTPRPFRYPGTTEERRIIEQIISRSGVSCPQLTASTAPQHAAVEVFDAIGLADPDNYDQEDLEFAADDFMQRYSRLDSEFISFVLAHFKRPDLPTSMLLPRIRVSSFPCYTDYEDHRDTLLDACRLYRHWHLHPEYVRLLYTRLIVMFDE